MILGRDTAEWLPLPSSGLLLVVECPASVGRPASCIRPRGKGYIARSPTTKRCSCRFDSWPLVTLVGSRQLLLSVDKYAVGWSETLHRACMRRLLRSVTIESKLRKLLAQTS